MQGVRISQYEHGNRKAKIELMEQIAQALDITVMSLADPNVCDPLGVMYALFEMEEKYNLELVSADDSGDIQLRFHSNTSKDSAAIINRYLQEWYRVNTLCQKIISKTDIPDAKEVIEDKYMNWKRQFNGNPMQEKIFNLVINATMSSTQMTQEILDSDDEFPE